MTRYMMTRKKQAKKTVVCALSSCMNTKQKCILVTGEYKKNLWCCDSTLTLRWFLCVRCYTWCRIHPYRNSGKVSPGSCLLLPFCIDFWRMLVQILLQSALHTLSSEAFNNNKKRHCITPPWLELEWKNTLHTWENSHMNSSSGLLIPSSVHSDLTWSRSSGVKWFGPTISSTFGG